MEKFPQLRAPITNRLLETFTELKTGRVFRGALWIIGEYASDISCKSCYFYKFIMFL